MGGGWRGWGGWGGHRQRGADGVRLGAGRWNARVTVSQGVAFTSISVCVSRCEVCSDSRGHLSLRCERAVC